MTPITIDRADARYQASLRERFGSDAPAQLTALGDLALLALPKTGLFCSARCPGDVILPTYDQAARWRDAGRCIIGGFHSPVEKECLDLLLRGTQPVVICPARSLHGMRVPAAWKAAIMAGRLLLLSPFAGQHRRITAELAGERNRFVAEIAEEIFVAHATPGSKTEQLCRELLAQGRRIYTFDLPCNAPLVALGAQPAVPAALPATTPDALPPILDRTIKGSCKAET
jgi:predicted Rossmann fold nucleotide-binding protein DprA/Smf involved in DNA uptake